MSPDVLHSLTFRIKTNTQVPVQMDSVGSGTVTRDVSITTMMRLSSRGLPTPIFSAAHQWLREGDGRDGILCDAV